MANPIRVPPRRGLTVPSPSRPLPVPASNSIPIYFMHTSNITLAEKDVAIGALEDILETANGKDRMPIIDFGAWKEPTYRDANGQLVPNMSVDWYVDTAFNPPRRQVNANLALKALLDCPYQKEREHYHVLLTAHDIYDNNTNFLVGLASGRNSTIISTARFRPISDSTMREETIRQEVYHEVGHLLGLVQDRLRLDHPRKGLDIEYNLGPHCTNDCAVRQGSIVPNNWIDFVDDRLRTGQIYCDPCTADLKDFFIKPLYVVKSLVVPPKS
tara:strand:- start:123 stop:935 length:813 start_codon:yes stop_codon:yes gene_type:complete